MYQCILFSASWALMKKFKGRLYPHWSMGTHYPIEFFLKDTIHLCVFSSLRSWRYCVVVEWDLAAEPSRAAKPREIPPRPYSLFLEHGSAAKTLISHQHNTASYAGYVFSLTDLPFLLFATVYSVTVSIMAFSNCDSLNFWGVHRKILFCLIN